MENTIVQKVTIKEKHQLYKGEEPANSIELLEFEENGFPIVAQKDLYSIGDVAYLVEPDYCIPDIPLFESYIRPYGDASKSKLGKKNNRIRAVKFNFHKGDGNPVFSYGILIPINELKEHFANKSGFTPVHEDGIATALGIIKYEAPEESIKGGVKSGNSGTFPSDMYKTDETNFNKICNLIEFPIHLVGTVKNDGSSTTIYVKNDSNYGICSRNLEKPIYFNKVVGTRKATLWEKFIKLFGWNTDLSIREKVLNDSDFVKASLVYLNALRVYCKTNNVSLALRGELIGASSKGSGNKNNPAKNLPLQLAFFGIDDYTGFAKKLPYNEFKKHSEALPLPLCEEVFNREFKSKEELIGTCELYFKNHLIEGLVLRNLDSTISCKYMNLAYDSKKD
jgi:RNA ligase (TIGR02306 family)